MSSDSTGIAVCSISVIYINERFLSLNGLSTLVPDVGRRIRCTTAVTLQLRLVKTWEWRRKYVQVWKFKEKKCCIFYKS